LRSGNFPLITGPKQLEFQARDTLEEILPVRPRVKEFLIGYPCLLLAGACPALAFGSLEVPLVLMGTAAGVSAVNSFCHIHSPVALSVFRGLMGLMAGVPIGLGLILLLALIHPPAPGRYVYIWGYLGFDNLGDDLILHAVLRVLDRELPPDVHLVVGTRNPRTFRPPDELGFLTARGRRIVGIRRMNPFAVARALAYAAASLSLGGGLFQDRTSRQSMVYYMLHLAMGQLRGIRHTWVLSQSIPEIRSGFFRDWLVDQLRRTDLTILRDPASAERLRLWSGSELNPVLSTDLTLWERPELPPPILESGLIGINLRPLPGTHEKADRDTIQDLTDSLVPFIKAQGLRVRYLIAEPDSDELPMRKLQECLDPEIFEVATISAHDPSAALSGLSGLIAMRYHVQVLAVLGGYPFFGISYAEKTAAWLEDLGHDSWIHVEGLDPQGFQVALRTWWTGRRKTYDSDHGDLEALEPRTRAGQAAFLAALRAFRCETSAGMRSPGE